MQASDRDLFTYPQEIMGKIIYKFLPLFVAGLFLTLATDGPALAEIYRWVDSEGHTHMTDNLFNVPQEYISQITTYQESSKPSKDGDVPMIKEPMGYVLNATINGIADVKLLLDTGATATVISPEALARGGVKVPKNKEMVLRTAGGEVKTAIAEIASLGIGDHRQGPMKVIAHDAVPGVDGLLGMDFLGKYRFEILTYGPKLRLSPP